jgi:hypothetical protein
MFNDPEFSSTYVEKMPIGMKMKSLFYDIPYLKHLNISHLLYLMHILKNVSSSLWRQKSLKKSGTEVIRRDPISLNTKNKHWTRKEIKGEVGLSCSFKEGDVPWILKKYDPPSLYGLTLQFCFIIEENLLRLKSHDHLNLPKECMSITCFIFCNIGYNFPYTHSFMPINFVCVYFIVTLSFTCACLCEP